MLRRQPFRTFTSVVDNLLYVKGKHTMNIGIEGRKYIEPEIFTQRIRGDYEYNLLSQYLNDVPARPPSVSATRPPGPGPTFYGDQSSIYIYGNDDWRVTSQADLSTSVSAGSSLPPRSRYVCQNQ